MRQTIVKVVTTERSTSQSNITVNLDSHEHIYCYAHIHEHATHMLHTYTWTHILLSFPIKRKTLKEKKPRFYFVI